MAGFLPHSIDPYAGQPLQFRTLAQALDAHLKEGMQFYVTDPDEKGLYTFDGLTGQKVVSDLEGAPSLRSSGPLETLLIGHIDDGEFLQRDGLNIIGVPGTGAGMNAVVDDTSPELGGDLDTAGFAIVFDEVTPPANPAVNSAVLYAKDDAGVTKLAYKNSAGEIVLDEGGGGGGVVDGDYGDVTVSGSNTVWTVDNDVVTNAKLANVAAATLKGRLTAGAGDPEDLTAAQVRTLINVADGATSNSADAFLLARSNQTGSQLAATISDFDAAAQSAVVTQTITDDETTTSPSENAVFGALELKAPLASPALTGVPTAPTALTSDDSGQIATTAFVRAVTAAEVVGLWDDRGNYDPTVTSTYPASGGSGAAGAVLKGDIWTINVAGTVDGIPIEVRQTVRALVDAPGTTAANWAVGLANTDIDDSITNGVTGRAPSQNAVFDGLASKQPLDALLTQLAALDLTGKYGWVFGVNASDDPELVLPESLYDAVVATGSLYETLAEAFAAGARNILIGGDAIETQDIILTENIQVTQRAGTTWDIGDNRILFAANNLACDFDCKGLVKWSPTTAKNLLTTELTPFTGDIITGQPEITGISISTSLLRVGQAIRSTFFDDATVILSIDGPDSATVSTNATSTETASPFNDGGLGMANNATCKFIAGLSADLTGCTADNCKIARGFTSFSAMGGSILLPNQSGIGFDSQTAFVHYTFGVMTFVSLTAGTNVDNVWSSNGDVSTLLFVGMFKDGGTLISTSGDVGKVGFLDFSPQTVTLEVGRSIANVSSMSGTSAISIKAIADGARIQDVVTAGDIDVDGHEDVLLCNITCDVVLGPTLSTTFLSVKETVDTRSTIQNVNVFLAGYVAPVDALTPIAVVDGQLVADAMSYVQSAPIVWSAADETAMLALANARVGDVASRKEAEPYILYQLKALPSSTLGNWVQVGASGGGGSGDVVGPLVSVDDRIATFDGTTGQLIQDGGSTIADVLSRANHTGVQLAATISDFAAEAQDAVVTQVITNGVLTTSPSEDAVFDALSLKLDATSNLSDVGDRQTALDNLTDAAAATDGYVLMKGPGGAEFVPPSGVSYDASATQGDITVNGFSTGVIPAGSTTDASLMLPADKTKLNAITGTNTGDQTITLTGDVTGGGTGTFAATIADDSVSLAKLQNAIASSKLLGSGASGAGADYADITLGTNLSMTGTTLNATAGAGGYSVIQEEGSGVAAQSTVNFIGRIVTAVDNSGASRTDVTFTPDNGIVTLASASTVNIGAAASDQIVISGSGTIDNFDTAASGVTRKLVFSGQAALNHSSALQLLRSAAMSTVAGDSTVFRSLGTGAWKQLSYQRQDGRPLIGYVTPGDLGDITTSGDVQTWTINDDAVTFAKMQDIATAKLLGRSTAGSGDVEELAVGAGLSLSAGTLSATGGGGGGYATVQEEGTPLTQRTALNFVGGLTATDNSGATSTDVTLADTLNSLASLGTAADKIAYTTGVGVWAEADVTEHGLAILSAVDGEDQLSIINAMKQPSNVIVVNEADDFGAASSSVRSLDPNVLYLVANDNIDLGTDSLRMAADSWLVGMGAKSQITGGTGAGRPLIDCVTTGNKNFRVENLKLNVTSGTGQLFELLGVGNRLHLENIRDVSGATSWGFFEGFTEFNFINCKMTTMTDAACSGITLLNGANNGRFYARNCEFDYSSASTEPMFVVQDMSNTESIVFDNCKFNVDTGQTAISITASGALNPRGIRLSSNKFTGVGTYVGGPDAPTATDESVYWVGNAGLADTPVSRAGDTMVGALNDAPPVTLASASEVEIGLALSNQIIITGITQIDGFDFTDAGATRTVVFDDVLTLNHNATSLILPTGADIITASGDTAEFLALGGVNWKCLWFQRASGAALSGSGGASVAGADTQVQFNDGGASFGGDAGFTYDQTTDTANLVGDLRVERVSLRDSDGSNYLHLDYISDIAVDRTLSISTLGNRTLTLNGSLTVTDASTLSGTNTGNQTASGVAFTPITGVPATDVQTAIGQVNDNAVDGPGISTPGGLASFADTTGHLLRDSSITIATTGALNYAATATIASAATVDIGAATSNQIIVSGSTTITSFGTAPAGAVRDVIFSGVLTLTHNATSLILPGGNSIITAINDGARLRSLGSGNWVVLSFKRQDGTMIAANVAGPASSADNTLVRFDSTTGKLIQASSVVLSDANELSQYNMLVSTKTANYTLAAVDNAGMVVFNSVSNLNLTIPQTSTVALAQGYSVNVLNINTGTVTFLTEGTDSVGGFTTLKQNEFATIIKRVAGSPNAWHISGGHNGLKGTEVIRDTGTQSANITYQVALNMPFSGIVTSCNAYVDTLVTTGGNPTARVQIDGVNAGAAATTISTADTVFTTNYTTANTFLTGSVITLVLTIPASSSVQNAVYNINIESD